MMKQFCDVEVDGIPCENVATKEIQFKQDANLKIYVCDEHIDFVLNNTFVINIDLSETSGVIL